MSGGKSVLRLLIDRGSLPASYPTHLHPPLFWEQLGRTIATFGFLELVLGKAIFAFTATRKYNSEDEAYKAFEEWLPKLERALTDQLCNLAESYGKAVRENQDSTIENIDQLVRDIKEATKIRNILCHGAWDPPDVEGKSMPSFVNKNLEICETRFDVQLLRQVQDHVTTLACDVIDTVTDMGWKFPGGSGPGETIWHHHS
jgi:hypothetical protein